METYAKSLITKVLKLDPEARLPKYATDGSGCFDIFAVMREPTYIYYQAPKAISTGLAFEIPEGHVMLIFSRSGHGFKNATRLSNCVGVIDSDYRGELRVKITKDSEYAETLTINHGDRIAQGMIVPIPKVSFVEAASLTETDRGEGGFGHTGA